MYKKILFSRDIALVTKHQFTLKCAEEYFTQKTPITLSASQSIEMGVLLLNTG